MKRWSLGRLLLESALWAAGWALVALGCMFVGSSGVHWPAQQQLAFRLEVVLLASLVGAALGCAGMAYQAVLRNPLADPYLLGASSGASLAAYLWRFELMTPLALGLVGGALSQQAFAFVGAALSVGVVFLIAQRRGRLEPVTLLLCGVIVNAVNAAVFLLINALRKDMTSASGGMLTFLVGGIQTNLTSQQALSAAAVVAVGWGALLLISGRLNLAGLGEAEATALGTRIHRLRWLALIVASLITAAAVAISGPVAFVGLICPHVARLVVGGDQRRLLPAATAVGAMLLALADGGSRFLAGRHMAETLLPVGVLTGLLGGPFFLALLWRADRGQRT